jgi:hypothetical protein
VAEIEILRRELSMRLNVRIEPGRADNGAAFKKQLCCEVLRRRGLTRPEIGRVMMLTRRGVDNSLRIVSSRLRSPAFAEYVDNLSTTPDEYFMNAVLARWS